MICPFRSVDPRYRATECEGDHCMFWNYELRDCAMAAFFKQQVKQSPLNPIGFETFRAKDRSSTDNAFGF